jgi:hypothetical protein
MFTVLHVATIVIANRFKPRRRLEAENLLLRHQLSITLQRAPPRLRLGGMDRATLLWMVRLYGPALALVRLPGLLALEIKEEGGAAEDLSWPA